MNSPEPSTDEHLLARLGYRQELARRMSGFSNFAISLSIICILAGGITSFHVGLDSAGGISIGLGWPLTCLFSLCVAATMAQVGSAFPTAGGLYHWGCLLGGRGCGWTTAWFNLAGLITVLAAINAGTHDFAVAAFGVKSAGPGLRLGLVVAMTLSQAALNHRGIRLTTRLIDLSGWLILAIAAVLTVSLLVAAPHLDWSRLWTFKNFTGLPDGAATFPKQTSPLWVFALGLLLPAYTLTGFDASAHTAEETLDAARNVPRGIVRAVAVSGLVGWALVVSILLAIPDLPAGVTQGADVVHRTMRAVLPGPLATCLLVGIVLVQYLCGLAALTSASRMLYAFARDGGLPGSTWLKQVQPSSGSPSVAVWTAAVLSGGLILLLAYETIAAIGTVFLYVSYVLPVAAGALAIGRSWHRMGPWQLGAAFRPLAVVSALGCVFLVVIGVQPPNQQALPILFGTTVLMLAVWFGFERRRFQGPPSAVEPKR